MPYLAGYATPQDYGATGNGTTDDTSAVQSAITAVAAAGGVLLIPAGTYKLSSALTMANYVEFRGMGSGVSVFNQTSTTANALTGVDLNNVKLTGLSINGPGSGSGIGVNFDLSVNADTSYVVMDDVRVASFGSHGVQVKSPIASRFSRVNVTSNVGDGWHVYGTGTSCHWTACYALNNTSGIGYHLIGLSYSSLAGCASDSNVDGYSLSGCTSVALTGCGAESSTTDGYILSGGSGNSLSSCFVYGNNHYGVHVTSAEANATINGLVEHSPGGSAVAAIITDTGTSAVVINENVVTADSYATGTTVQLTPTGTAVFPMEASFSNATSAFKYPGNIVSQPTATGNTILSSNLNGSASFDNFRLLGSGTLVMGPGTAARDTQLARTATGTLSITNPVTTHGAVEILDGNLVVGGTATLGDNGVGEIQIANASTVPTTNPTGGVSLYASGGALYFRNPSGFVNDLTENATTSTSTATTVTGVTALTALANGSTVAANTLAAGQVYKVKAWGVFTCTTAQNIRFDLMWGGTGGTSLLNWGTYTPTANQTGSAWAVDFDFVANSSTQITTVGELYMAFFLSTMTQQTTTVTSSSNEQMVLAVTPSATGVSITCNGFYFMRVH